MRAIAAVLGVLVLMAPVHAGAKDAPAKKAEVATPTATKEPPLVLPEYALDTSQSFLKFIATQNNAPVVGKFTDFDASVFFAPEHPPESHMTVTVNVGSLQFTDEQTKQTILSAEWLGADKFPKAVFTAKSFDRVPDTEDYYAKGELELKGVKAPVTLNFHIDFMDDSKVVASGYATLQRGDFGIGQKEWAKDDIVKKTVRVEFRVVALKKKP